jgi:hypothetical protein
MRLRPAHAEGDRARGSRLPGGLGSAVPYELHTAPIDDGVQFADLLPSNRRGTYRQMAWPFDRACRSHGIQHRLSQPNYPWSNGQVERMNRTLKEATVRRYH